MRLRICLFKTVHFNKKPVKQLSEELGISGSYLYRAAQCTETNAVRFPLELLIPLMKAANDFSLLKYLANVCGYILTREPKVKNSRVDEFELLSNYQDKSSELIKSAKEYFKNKNKTSFNEAMLKIDETIEETVTVKKYLLKSASGQFELEF